ncbi:MAG: hypothetical protein IPO06_09215 [Leptospiraceae bacterium]|nr:hypothetical protein [Leptospiraceae bacterium]
MKTKFTVDIEQIVSKKEIKIVIKNYPLIMNKQTLDKFGIAVSSFLQYFYKIINGKDAQNENT